MSSNKSTTAMKKLTLYTAQKLLRRLNKCPKLEKNLAITFLH